MWIKYRSFSDSVSDTSRKNRYGYFERLESLHPKTKEILKIGTYPTSDKDWPLRIQVQFDIHNHEDLQMVVDKILEAYDCTRGEYGENEKTSPSDFRMKLLGGK